MFPNRFPHLATFRDVPVTAPYEAAVAELRNAISNESNNALHARLQNAGRAGTVFPAQELSDLLDHACQHRRSSNLRRAITGLPGFDPNVAGPTGRTPLASAVQCEDTDLVRHLLMQGADPSPHVTVNRQPHAQQEIHNLLYAAKVINKLFPRGAPLDELARSPLGTAMRRYDMPRVVRLLAAEQARHPGLSTFGLWMQAVHEQRADIRCAILTTRPHTAIEAAAMRLDETGRSALHSGMRHSPPALRAYLKQYPYYSDKRGPAIHGNDVASFPEDGEPIVCRHLASFWLMQRVGATDGKYDYSALQSPELLARQVPPSMEEKFLELRTHAGEAHLFHKDHWGGFLMRQFETMDASLSAGETSCKRRILLLTDAHALAAELKLEHQPNGSRQYSALLYDPNATNVHKRASTSDPTVVGQWKFASFLEAGAREAGYFPNDHFIMTAYVITDIEAAAPPSGSARQPFAAPGRTATSCPSPLEPTVFRSLVRNGFDGDLWQHKQDIVAHLRSLPPDEATAFLSGADRTGTPSLHIAMLDGYDGSVAAFAGIVSECGLPREALIDLIATKGDDGAPGLFVALHQGNGAVVAQYGRLLTQSGLSSSDKMDLLLARDTNGIPGVIHASVRGHDEAVEIFQELLHEHLSEAQQAAVWAAVEESSRAAVSGGNRPDHR
ncbi:ShET2/EspL2 family type III secretion system effector toxin [Herbaspirillum sp. ST 5-3]|uniref:ShET2/EspL2 family type III secretion system effector toxin n=1 Tax=Oxalobacteraceae TaxID=75682 RepID=UPI0010A521B6|nr:ShET2/EspL2 family type III secretion system effector toxin [Herbaspirillum sp. ST 5-3]